MVDIAESVFVGVVAAELGKVGTAEVVIVGVVAVGLGKVGTVESVIVGVVAAGLGKFGTADVDRHRLVVPWLPSYTVAQFVVGVLNSHSCLGWSNYIVDYSNPQRTVFG